MPRLAAPDPTVVPDDVRSFLAQYPPDPLITALSHAPGTVQPFIELAMAQFRSLQLPARSRELVTLVVAELAECAFVRAQHEPMSQAAGVTPAVRELIAHRRFDDPALTPYDRALLSFAAAVVAGPRVPDDVFAAARGVLSDREIVEAVQVCGYYWMFGRVCTVLEIEPAAVHGTLDV